MVTTAPKDKVVLLTLTSLDTLVGHHHNFVPFLILCAGP